MSERDELNLAGIRHIQTMTAEVERDNAMNASRPSMQLRPRLTLDGNQWCALHGENLQDGVAGFGSSPDEAYRAFDIEWVKAIVFANNWETAYDKTCRERDELRERAERAEMELAEIRSLSIQSTMPAHRECMPARLEALLFGASQLVQPSPQPPVAVQPEAQSGETK